jgi:hypothetical protein
MSNQISKIAVKMMVLSILAMALLSSCTSDYHKVVERELASGERYDSLFLGLKFGMTSKEFYAHCWELNRQKLVVQGSANATVKYDLDGLKQPANMDFYPDFYEDKIFQMPVTIAYKAWAPWNKELSSDSLQLDVLELFKEWYGDGFLKVVSSERGVAFVKVDGNRRITIYKPDELDIHVLFTDLLVENKLKKLKK